MRGATVDDVQLDALHLSDSVCRRERINCGRILCVSGDLHSSQPEPQFIKLSTRNYIVVVAQLLLLFANHNTYVVLMFSCAYDATEM